MEQLKQLKVLSEKTAPGRFPSYTPAHLLYALIFLDKNKVGRKQLAVELRVGEGTVRTIIRRLQDEELVSIDRSGITLSSIGSAFLDSIREKLAWSDFPQTEITLDTYNYLVLCHGAEDKVRLGVEQRDQALIHGAKGATTLVFREGNWRMPGADQVLKDNVIDFLGVFSPKQGDVAIIGSSDERFTAALGGLAATLDLF